MLFWNHAQHKTPNFFLHFKNASKKDHFIQQFVETILWEKLSTKNTSRRRYRWVPVNPNVYKPNCQFKVQLKSHSYLYNVNLPALLQYQLIWNKKKISDLAGGIHVIWRQQRFITKNNVDGDQVVFIWPDCLTLWGGGGNLNRTLALPLAIQAENLPSYNNLSLLKTHTT